MRKLRADEIECRVAQVTAKGCSLLLYKTARVDRAILDEEFGQFGWQNDFKVIDGKMYGGIGIYSNDLGEWLWRWDCGTESNTEAEKGQASDCFKRAGFKWGIGVELYTTPFIFVQCATVKDEYASKKAGKDVYKLADKYTKFEVTKIGYADNGDICNLSIKDNKGELVYEMGKIINRPVINPDTDIIEGLKACASYTELQRYYKANYEAVQDKKAFNQLATKLKAKFKEKENEQ
jgi:hypothetical protein